MAFSKAITLLSLLTVISFTCISSHTIPCPPKSRKCPKDTLKFGVCGEWLGLVSEVIGAKPSPQCCELIQGLANLEAALCLCTAIKANVLGVIKIDVPVALSLLVNGCGKNVPKDFVCP